MSNSGPAPASKKKAGFGCQPSGPGDCISASAVSGRPIAPSSMSRRAVWSPAPRNVSGAHPTRSPAFRAASSSARPSARPDASGFSFQTCLPAAIASCATSAWAAGIVRFTTISTSGWPSTTSGSPAAATSNSAARARATSGSRSPIATTVVSGKAARFLRYSELMLPAPTIPMPTGPLRSRSAIDDRREEFAARPNRRHQVARGVVELDDPEGRRRGGDDLADRDDPRADGRLALRVERSIAILEMQRDDPLPEPAEQGGHVGATGVGPVGIDLQDDLRCERVREDLERVTAVDPGDELEVVVVVADPNAGVADPSRDGIQVRRDRRDAFAGLPARGFGPGLDDDPGTERGRAREN